jgi:hypothetical protein
MGQWRERHCGLRQTGSEAFGASLALWPVRFFDDGKRDQQVGIGELQGRGWKSSQGRGVGNESPALRRLSRSPLGRASVNSVK